MKVPTFKMLGSKARMAKWVLENVPDKEYKRWIEPFAGRGNVYFRALHDKSVAFEQALLNDRYMIKFIEALRDVSDFSFVDPSPIDKSLYEKWRGMPKSRHRWLAESYVCRMGGSFVWGDETRESWEAQPGDPGPNTTCSRNRHNKKGTEARMQAAHDLMSKNPPVTSDIEWETFLRIANPGPDDIIYCDPPYNTKHKVPYPNIDHEALLNFLDSTPATVLLSGFNNPLYDAWLQSPKWNKVERERALTAGAVRGKKKPKKLEVLWVKA
jgi:site-specific DNA-adenine methylase